MSVAYENRVHRLEERIALIETKFTLAVKLLQNYLRHHPTCELEGVIWFEPPPPECTCGLNKTLEGLLEIPRKP